MEFLDTVNERDEVTGKASLKEVYEKLLTHRIVHVLIFNEKGEMALQLRSKTVPFCPGHWATPAGGHVRSGESYEQAALREFEEELGTKAPIALSYKDIFQYESGIRKFLATFRAYQTGTATFLELVELANCFEMAKSKSMSFFEISDSGLNLYMTALPISLVFFIMPSFSNFSHKPSNVVLEMPEFSAISDFE